RERDDGAAELLALLAVAQRHVHGGLGDADGPRRGLDAGGFEGLHELLEALPPLAAKEVFGPHLEPVEGDLELLHAAIAEHLDLGARHAGSRKRIPGRAARLFGGPSREAAMS